MALGGRTSSYDQILLVRYVLACPKLSKLCLQKQQASGCKSIQTSEYGALFVGITGDRVRYPGETLNRFWLVEGVAGLIHCSCKDEREILRCGEGRNAPNHSTTILPCIQKSFVAAWSTSNNLENTASLNLHLGSREREIMASPVDPRLTAQPLTVLPTSIQHEDAEADDGDVVRNLKDKTRDRERAKSKDKSYELPKPGANFPEVPELRINKKDYRPASSYLPVQECEFRILRLDPGGGGDDKNISCSFVRASVDRP